MKINKFTYISMLLSLVLLLGGMTSCSNGDTSEVISPSNVEWKNSSVASQAGAAALLITGLQGTGWTARIVEGEEWCSFNNVAQVSATSGNITPELDVIYIYYKANTSASSRSASVDFTFAGDTTRVLTLSQSSSNGQTSPLFSSWPELPSKLENSNYLYVTHYTSINSSNIRNYTLCFDITKKAALWVAYPLHNAYLGSTNRTDAWTFDPNIAETYQANCINRSYTGNWDRGHQLPSADRLANYQMNAQTFYMSNMTPQLDRLNQDMWAKLETKVRNNRCSDTLYVVTGAVFGTGAQTTTDGAGNVVPIPTNYFKVLLRTRTGNTGKSIAQCSDGELMTIGFWVDQKSYGNIEPPATICTTVTDIEKKTGFTFFPEVSSSVKSQNFPTLWGIN